ncbi:MAG: GNAT family N-acetyltransferase [Proteobacteria bacterium]|nr:GNAT family N-acetyltransferase [Pseudomonadota bacterium]
MSPPLKIKFLLEDDFCHFKEEWNALLDLSNSSSFFLKWEWLFSFWSTLPKRNCELSIFLLYENSNLVGIGPFYLQKEKFYGFAVKKLTFLGNTIASDYLDIFSKPGYEEKCCEAVINSIASQQCLVEFTSLSEEANVFTYFKKQHNSNHKFKFIFCEKTLCPRILLPESVTEFNESLSKSTKYLLKRKQKKIFNQFPSIKFKNIPFKEKSYLDELFSLHKKRWDLISGNKSTFYSDYRKQFNNKFIQLCSNHDGFFSIIEIEGKVVSLLYLFQYKKQLFFYQNGWEPEFAQVSIGLVHIKMAVEEAIGEKYLSFDMLRGDEQYKYKFSNDVRNIFSLMMFNNNLQGYLFYLLHNMVLSIKQNTKKNIGSICTKLQKFQEG